EVLGMPRIGRKTQPGPAEPVRIGPVVAAERTLWIRSGSPGWREWNATTGCEDNSQFPSAQGPLGWCRHVLWGSQLPGSVHHYGFVHVEIGEGAAQSQVPPRKTRDRVPECVAGHR